MLSIIIPVYNVEQYIEACLDSILTQNLNDFEIICINDGSTDNSLGILEKYQNKERRLKIYSQKNSGPGVARNFAINIAKGDYICFVDPDDKLEPLSLDSVYQFAIEKKLKVVQFNYKTFQENKDYKEYNFAEQILNLYNYDLNKIKYYNFNNVLKDCFHAFDMHIVNKIYSRDFIIKNKIYFTNDRYAEDWLFAIIRRD